MILSHLLRPKPLWQFFVGTLLAASLFIGGCGGGSSTVTSPSITTQPSSITIASGSSGTLAVVASGSSLTYQWYLNAAAISGATSASLTVTAAGSYYVVVSNSAGSVSSSTVTVTVTTTPVITTQPASAVIVSGDTTTLSVVATGSGLSYQWYLDGTAISGATASTYVASAAGSYYVVVTNASGSVTSSTATVTVSSAAIAPTITTQPVATSVVAGNSATLSVVASGTSLTYQWYKDSVAVSGATSASYTIATTTVASAGSYYVVVSNTVGSVTSNTVTLTVTTTVSGSNTAAVVTAANAFLDTLSTTQKTVATSASSTSTVLFDFTRANAITWTNLPGSRHGLRLNSSTLSTSQLAAASTLISTALSSTGTTLMDEIRLADDVIASTGSTAWSSTLYSIAIMGSPSTSSAWMLQLTGHHLAYNITYNGSYVSATPMFIGVEPPNWVVTSSGSYTVNNTASTSGTAHAPLEAQRLAVYNLATAIQADSSVASAAKLSGTFTDVIMGAVNSADSNYGSLAYPTSGRGVLYSALNSTEQAYVQAAIEAWVNTQASDIASTLLAVYLSDTALASTYVGYGVGTGGSADFSAYPNSLSSPLNAQHSYLRIDGPRVWIEFVVQQGVAYTSYVHYHSLWRDKTADYGAQF